MVSCPIRSESTYCCPHHRRGRQHDGYSLVKSRVVAGHSYICITGAAAIAEKIRNSTDVRRLNDRQDECSRNASGINGCALCNVH